MKLPITLDEPARKATCEKLQALLTELVNLALQLKQAHWNVRGPLFKPVHEQLDEIVDDARTHSDDVAERITALGVSADGRVTRLQSESSLPEFPEGHLGTRAAVEAVSERMTRTIRVCRTILPTLAEADSISEDLVIGITASLEKHHWMLWSQLESE